MLWSIWRLQLLSNSEKLDGQMGWDTLYHFYFHLNPWQIINFEYLKIYAQVIDPIQ